MIDETQFLYDLGRLFLSNDIPLPGDLRNKLNTNLGGGKAWRLREPQELKGLVFHQELGWGTVENVAKFHTSPESNLYPGGVESIAYTFAIRRDGQVVLCNDFDKSTWSHGTKDRPGNENAEFMSVMFEGFFNYDGCANLDGGEPTLQQMQSALLLWYFSRKLWGWDNTALYGHYHFGKDKCPGNTLRAIIEAVRA